MTKKGWGTKELSKAHASPPALPADATSRWNKFKHKAKVQNGHLLDEQFLLCCYSEVRAHELGIGYHVEHVENKSQAPHRTFEYQNLAASAFDSLIGLVIARQQAWEVFGGHAVGKRGVMGPVNMSLFVSPHQPDSDRFFAYLSSGRIEPRFGLTGLEPDRAEYTIGILNLNSPYLVSLRRAWWDELQQFWDEHDLRGWSVPHLMQVDLLPINGHLSPFFSLTRQFYSGAADALLLTTGLL